MPGYLRLGCALSVLISQRLRQSALTDYNHSEFKPIRSRVLDLPEILGQVN